jgi:hypothetical protein
MGATNLTVDSTSFKFSGTTHPDVVAAFARYTELMFPHAVPSAGETASAAATGCTVTVKSDSKDLQLETDESYKLIVPADGSAITIDAPTYGESILRGGFAWAQRACDG